MSRTAQVTITCDNCGGTWTKNEDWSRELPSLSSFAGADIVYSMTTGTRKDYCSLCVDAVNDAIEEALEARKPRNRLPELQRQLEDSQGG